MTLTQTAQSWISYHAEEMLELLIRLAQIPAPSHQEHKRAQFCLDWLKAQGAERAYMDDALNVILPFGSLDAEHIMVFMAHSDVVFPDTTPLPLHITDGKLYCPGVGDDTANVAALLMAAKHILEKQLLPQDACVLLVINSCEEGLGNLKGCRKIMDTFGAKVREFVTFDAGVFTVINEAVGSRRYQIEIKTEGGHSYSAFGNRNAIACMAELIHDLYSVPVPAIGKTTYNVGTVSGGTSVNTIAQQAQMLYEFRSDKREALQIMEDTFRNILAAHRAKGLDITVTQVGSRPCSDNVDAAALEALSQRAMQAVAHNFGHQAGYGSGSTDCNIPLSMGIPAICIGCADGAGAHTREEFVYIDSLKSGLGLALEMILYHF